MFKLYFCGTYTIFITLRLQFCPIHLIPIIHFFCFISFFCFITLSALSLYPLHHFSCFIHWISIQPSFPFYRRYQKSQVFYLTKSWYNERKRANMLAWLANGELDHDSFFIPYFVVGNYIFNVKRKYKIRLDTFKIILDEHTI